MFIDERLIQVKGGSGGDGIVHWRRALYEAKGGPDGGNGGKGGDVYMEAVRNIGLLAQYQHLQLFAAENGNVGEGRNREGKSGDDIVVQVPIGAIVTNMETREVFEFVSENEKILVAVGGEGGLGNTHFKSSRNTTPYEFTRGGRPQAYTLKIDLQLIADVGIIGLPNAGKSTMLNTLTNAHARIGEYPFTTIEPNLGSFHGYILADLPGLIEGASVGKGLGYRFLKHIARTKKLLHLISLENDVVDAYKIVRKELKNSHHELENKKEIIVLTKTDTVSGENIETARIRLRKITNNEILFFSAIDDELVKQFTEEFSHLLQQ
ncbi:MAG: GTPase ObgE [Alphaproteobacteria bacterium]|nr:GTPase ObgE [Alphaproteobacteria bacterium]